MFAALQAVTLQRTAILVLGAIGIACCVSAVLTLQQQHAEDTPPLRPLFDQQAKRQETHHMRSRLLPRSHDPGPAQHLDTGARGVG